MPKPKVEVTQANATHVVLDFYYGDTKKLARLSFCHSHKDAEKKKREWLRATGFQVQVYETAFQMPDTKSNDD